MGQLEKYGLYVLCLVIFMILGVALWGDPASMAAERGRREGARLSAQGAADPKAAAKPAATVPGLNLDALFDGKGGAAPTPQARGSENAGNGGSGNSGSTPVGGGTKPADVPAPDTKRPTYVIKAGDSFESIARTQLKDAGLLELVMQLNPDVSPKRMQPGKELVLPSAAEIAARKAPPLAKASETPKVDAKPDAKGTAKADPKVVTPIAAEERLYTVQKGDTFERIAQAELGSRKRTAELMAANPGIKPEGLRKGQRIKLPKK